MEKRSLRRTIVHWTLNLVFLGWVLYFTATGRLLPQQFVAHNSGPHPPQITQPIVPSGDQAVPVQQEGAPGINRS